MKISPRQQRSVLSTYYFRNLSGLVKSGNKVGGCSTARAPHYLNFRPFWARARRATRQWVSPAAAAGGEGRPSQPQTSSPPYSAAGNHARDWKKGFLFEEVEVVQYLGKAVCNGVQRRRCRQCSAIVFSVMHPWHQTNRCHSQLVSQSLTSNPAIFLLLLLLSTFSNVLLFRAIHTGRIFTNISSHNLQVWSVCLSVCLWRIIPTVYTTIWGVFCYDILCCDWKRYVPAQTVLRPHDPIWARGL